MDAPASSCVLLDAQQQSFACYLHKCPLNPFAHRPDVNKSPARTVAVQQQLLEEAPNKDRWLHVSNLKHEVLEHGLQKENNNNNTQTHKDGGDGEGGLAG